ncbi:hypothetical protein BB560_007146, partial [Smittium megazygosporum]
MESSSSQNSSSQNQPNASYSSSSDFSSREQPGQSSLDSFKYANSEYKAQPLVFSGISPDISKYRLLANDPVSQSLSEFEFQEPDFIEVLNDFVLFVSFRLSNFQEESSEFADIQPTVNSAAAVNFRQSVGTGKVNHNGYTVSAGDSEGKYYPLQPYQINSTDRNKWSIIKALYSHPSEGFLSLFKGSFTKWTQETMNFLLQPTVESMLNYFLDAYSDPSLSISDYGDLSTSSPIAALLSHVVVGYLLSPLDIVRTRLEIQPSSPIYRKYNGIWDTLKKINSEEGGIVRGIYLNPFHSIPSIIQSTVNSFFENFGPSIFSSIINYDPYVAPFT